jgi:MarR family transcriptional regulator, organic hydroperoxide resistance regulator
MPPRRRHRPEPAAGGATRPAAVPSARDFQWRGRTARTQHQFETHVAMQELVTELEREGVELLKATDLSPAQYNVLRILRGAGPEGATCGDLTSRLVKHDPDVTRLLDRLERRELIVRTREIADRRVVRTRITKAGLALLAELDDPVDALHERQLGHLTERQLGDLQALVAVVRTRRPG